MDGNEELRLLPSHPSESTDFVELLAGLGHGHVVIVVPGTGRCLKTRVSVLETGEERRGSRTNRGDPFWSLRQTEL